MSKSFKNMSERVPDSALIVDSLNLGYRWKHKKVLAFMDEYLKTVDSIQASYKMERSIITADYGGSAYRKALYPAYKANRDELKAQQTPEESEYFKKFLEEMMKTLEKLKEYHPVLQYKGVEADDIAGFVVGNKAKLGISKIWLVSGDADWDQLISPDVSRFSTASRKEVTFENWSEHYDYSIEDHISIKCIMGDSGDNVPGVVGIGPKKAMALIEQYGTAFDVAAALPITSKYKHIQTLNEFGSEAILRNYQLMDIPSNCAEAIGSENCADIIERLTA
jgi:5'-3' exonuclease